MIDWQLILVFISVSISVIFFLRRLRNAWSPGSKSKACGGNCSCQTNLT
jgi:hypothetical protein